MSAKLETSNFFVSQRFYIWLDCFRLTKHTVVFTPENYISKYSKS